MKGRVPANEKGTHATHRAHSWLVGCYFKLLPGLGGLMMIPDGEKVANGCRERGALKN